MAECPLLREFKNHLNDCSVDPSCFLELECEFILECGARILMPCREGKGKVH